MAELTFNYGCMNSSKSTNLIQTHYNFTSNNKNVLVLKPTIDTKSCKVSSRIGVECTVDINVPEEMDIFEEVQKRHFSKSVDCVLMDEAQFLSKKQAKQLLQIAGLLNVPVIAYGLRVDAFATPFEGAAQLMAFANRISEFETYCACGQKASMNARSLNGVWQKGGSQVAIDDGSLEYKALCLDCYQKFVGLI